MRAWTANPTRQGQPLNAFAPRGGFAWSVTEQDGHSRRLRALLGADADPGVGESAIGARGYSASTTFLASTDGGLTPAGSICESVPDRHHAAAGQLARLADRRRRRHRLRRPGLRSPATCSSTRSTGSGSCRAGSWSAIGYMGSRSERLSMGGTSDATVNINQLDPAVPGAGHGAAAARAESVLRDRRVRQPEPLGDDLARPAAAAVSAVRQRARRTASTRRSARYNAVVARWNKRHGATATRSTSTTPSAGSRTTSSARRNTFSNRQGSALDNYDLGREFGVSLLDVAHRLNVNATVPAAVRRGTQVADGAASRNALLGGWQVTVAGRYQTGFPVNISQSSNNSGLLGSNQRPNLVEGVDVMTTGSQEERAVNGWINPAAFSAAPAFTFGNVAAHQSATGADPASARPTWRSPRRSASAARRVAPRRRAEPVRRPAVHRAGDHLRHVQLRPNHDGRRLRPLGAVPSSVRFLTEGRPDGPRLHSGRGGARLGLRTPRT